MDLGSITAAEKAGGWLMKAWHWLRKRRTTLAALQEENASLKRQLREFEHTQRIVDNLVFEHGVFWLIRNSGKDGPFCPVCWDADQRLIHLIAGATKGCYWCTIHKADFTTSEYKSSRPVIRSRRFSW